VAGKCISGWPLEKGHLYSHVKMYVW